MDLYALNKDYTLNSIISSNNVQWNRKYYEVGDFSVQIPANQYNPAMAFIYRPDRTELGIIQKPVYSEKNGTQYIQLSGLFAESELNDKIVYPTFYASGNIDTEIKRMITTYKEDIPNLVVDVSHGIGSNIEFQESFGYLGEVAQERLKSQEMSQRIKYNYEQNTKVYEVWQGTDRTQAQTANNTILFSTEFENLSDIEVFEDSSDMKNWALVGGSGEGADRIFTEVDLSGGYYKQKMFVNASGEHYDPEKQTLEEYKANLRQKGLEELLKRQKICNVDFISEITGYIYMKDFDLGDKCDVYISALQLPLEARIIAIYEVYKDNQESIELEFGNKMLTPIQKERYK